MLIINLFIKVSRKVGELFYNLPDLVFDKSLAKRAFSSFLDNDLDKEIGSVSYRKFHYDIKNIPGMTGDCEGQLLFYLALLGEVKGDVIEIGSWLGRSTLLLAKGCQISGNGIVHAVDTFKGNPGKEHIYKAPLKKGETIFRRFLENIRLVGLEKFVEVHKSSSEMARGKLGRVRARLIFIDACHDYEEVKRDIENWESLLIYGGYMVLHDFSSDSIGCVRAISEDIVNSDSYKLMVLLDSMLVVKKI